MRDFAGGNRAGELDCACDGAGAGVRAHLPVLRRDGGGAIHAEQALTLEDVETLAAEGKPGGADARMRRTLLPEMPAVTADDQDGGADPERGCR